MKRLYILRHSKAGQAGKKLLDDHERPLTEKGSELCPPIGKHLSNCDTPPDLVLCSPALRTRQTAEQVIRAMDTSPELKLIPALYLATPDDILNIIQKECDERYKSTLIVGHNPGLQQLCILIAGSGDKSKFRDLRNNFPPAALATYNLENCNNWLDIGIQSGTLIDFQTAKKLHS